MKMLKSLQTKLIFSFLIVIWVPLVFVSFFATYFISPLTRLKYALKEIQKECRLREEKALTFAQSYASISEVKELLREEDRETLLHKFMSLKEERDLDLMELSNEKGIILLRTHLPDKFGDDKSKDPQIKSALEGKTIVDLQEENEKIVISATLPVKENAKIIGVIRTGYILDNKFADAMRKITNMQIFLYTKDRLYTSTFLLDWENNRLKTLPLSKEFLEDIFKKGGKKITNINILNSSYSVKSFPFLNKEGEVIGILLGGFPNGHILKALAIMRKTVFLITSIGGLLALIVAVFVSRRFVSPVKKLTNLTKKIAQGNLEGKVDIKSNDEIGILAQSFEHMVQRLKITRKKEEKLSNGDFISGLFNHRYFQEHLQKGIEKAKGGGYSISLIMCDVDYFKNYNDTQGHLKGDKLLKVIGKIFKSHLRVTDLAARYGGDEFAIALSYKDKKEVFEIAERLRTSILKYSFPGEKAQPEDNVTMSFGIAIYPFTASSTKDLLEKADKALYKAKRTGRNKVCIYGSRYPNKGNSILRKES